jgi:NADH dehydrogenase FAD-containing subunit
METVNVVVVGAGLAGLMCISHLMKKAPTSTPLTITLIERKDYYEYIPASLRCMVKPKHFEDISVPLEEFREKLMKRQSVHKLSLYSQCEATGLDREKQIIYYKKMNSEVVEELNYQYLVLACGSDYIAPYIKPSSSDVTMEHRLKSFNLCLDKIKSTDNLHILVVGGGSVGVELVGEIVDLRNELRKDFQITLVHSKDKLLERCGDKMHNYTNSFFQRNGVNVLLNDRVIPDSQYDYSTDAEPTVIKKLQTKNSVELSDITMVFWCHSCKPATKWLVGSIDMDDHGNVSVTNSLQCTNYPNIFALGDISSYPCEKTAGNARDQGDLVGKHIVTLLSEQKKGKALNEIQLSNFSTKGFLMNVSLGYHDGAFVLGSAMLMWGKLSAFSKRKIENLYGVKPIRTP